MSGKYLCASQLLAATLVLGCAFCYDFTRDPLNSLQSSLIILVPALLGLYASTTHEVFRAFARGVLSIPVGAVLISFIGVSLGAPFELGFAKKTILWSLFMSTLTIAPAATVLGSSWLDWQRILAFTRPSGPLELCICLPAYGAAIGAWLGAWPMPLDWDREWQEWPVSCVYGGILGYVLGSVVTFFVSICMKPVKLD